MDFTGQVAISTGAASGMGLLFAQNWAELGGNVVMCDVDLETLQQKAEEINQKGKGKAIANKLQWLDMCLPRSFAGCRIAWIVSIRRISHNIHRLTMQLIA